MGKKKKIAKPKLKIALSHTDSEINAFYAETRDGRKNDKRIIFFFFFFGGGGGGVYK